MESYDNRLHATWNYGRAEDQHPQLPSTLDYKANSGTLEANSVAHMPEPPQPDHCKE